jgi:hypothetical protein
LLERIAKENCQLIDYIGSPSLRGIVTGLNEAFIIDADARNQLILAAPTLTEILRPVCVGSEIRRYGVEWAGHYLIYTYHGIDLSNYSLIEEFLENYRDQLENRAIRQEWYELQQPQKAYEDKLISPKIVMPDMAESGRFQLDENGMFLTNTAYFLPTDDKYLLALLNSKLLTFCLANTSSTFGGGYLRLFGQYVERLPIRVVTPQMSERKRKELIQNIVGLLEQKKNTSLKERILQLLLPIEEYADVIHDLLALLADQMIILFEERVLLVERFFY